MIDYKNYKITKKNKEQSDCKNKNSILDWIIFGIIVATLWGIAIEMLFK
jgi:hypothetical protein